MIPLINGLTIGHNLRASHSRGRQCARFFGAKCDNVQHNNVTCASGPISLSMVPNNSFIRCANHHKNIKQRGSEKDFAQFTRVQNISNFDSVPRKKLLAHEDSLDWRKPKMENMYLTSPTRSSKMPLFGLGIGVGCANEPIGSQHHIVHAMVNVLQLLDEDKVTLRSWR